MWRLWEEVLSRLSLQKSTVYSYLTAKRSKTHHQTVWILNDFHKKRQLEKAEACWIICRFQSQDSYAKQNPFKVRAWKSSAMATLRAIHQCTVNMSICLAFERRLGPVRWRSLNVPGCCGPRFSGVQWFHVRSTLCWYPDIPLLFSTPERSLSLQASIKVKQGLCNDLYKFCLRYLSWTFCTLFSSRCCNPAEASISTIDSNEHKHSDTCKPNTYEYKDR